MSTGFEQVAVQRPTRSRFDLSHDVKTTMRMGYMIPTMCVECMPNDTFTFSQEAMFRMMPMIAPIMHKVDVSFHSFFVPNRILWDNWEKFIFPESATALPPAAPYFNMRACTVSSLANYLGVPPVDVANTVDFKVNALPFAAYQRIWADWFRSQDLDPIANPEYLKLLDGDQGSTRANFLQQKRFRGWEHDYFTSCLPFAQKGNAVGLPIDLGVMPVQWNLGATTGSWRDGSGSLFGATGPGSGPGNTISISTANSSTVVRDSSSAEFPASYDPDPMNTGMSTLQVDATGYTVNTTINDLRSAWALQQFLEKNMRAGTRYREALEANFGQRSSDARLDRPEYIGGAKGTMAISEVLQTQSSDGVTPQGNMAGHGISVMGSAGLHYHCEEHGFIITVCSIIPKTSYFQGLPKLFSRFDRYDYPFPDFAQLGEQEVKNKELFLNPVDSLDDDTFGYLPRYAEYRNLPSRVNGEMAATLDFWHMGRKFASRPFLNKAFIECSPTDDIFAVEDDTIDNIVAHIVINMSAVRPLPVYGIPAPLV